MAIPQIDWSKELIYFYFRDSSIANCYTSLCCKITHYCIPITALSPLPPFLPSSKLFRTFFKGPGHNLKHGVQSKVSKRDERHAEKCQGWHGLSAATTYKEQQTHNNPPPPLQKTTLFWFIYIFNYPLDLSRMSKWLTTNLHSQPCYHYLYIKQWSEKCRIRIRCKDHWIATGKLTDKKKKPISLLGPLR